MTLQYNYDYTFSAYILICFKFKFKNELDRVRAEAKEARFQRKKEQEEQMKILTEIVKINFNDQNNYTTAIDTLTRGLNNLATLQQNWIRLQAFFGKVESFMEVNVVKSVEDLNKLTQKVLTGEMKITALMGKKIRIMTKNVIYFIIIIPFTIFIHCFL